MFLFFTLDASKSLAHKPKSRAKRHNKPARYKQSNGKLMAV